MDVAHRRRDRLAISLLATLPGRSHGQHQRGNGRESIEELTHVGVSARRDSVQLLEMLNLLPGHPCHTPTPLSVTEPP
jgi:hypothetical protein